MSALNMVNSLEAFIVETCGKNTSNPPTPPSELESVAISERWFERIEQNLRDDMADMIGESIDHAVTEAAIDGSDNASAISSLTARLRNLEDTVACLPEEDDLPTDIIDISDYQGEIEDIAREVAIEEKDSADEDMLKEIGVIYHRQQEILGCLLSVKQALEGILGKGGA